MPHFPEAQFLISSWQPRQFPADEGREVAFVGRSNAGKSSALNAIAGRRDLARTSKTPGRTQLINFFALKTGGRLVDLPGYGYAKVPAEMQRHWQQLMSSYVADRQSLSGLVIVVDARRGLTDFDRQMLAWVQDSEVPARVLLTKSDKLNRSESIQVLREVESGADQIASAQLFSAVTKSGVDDARGWILGRLEGKS
jgi:GTP-binding protein